MKFRVKVFKVLKRWNSMQINLTKRFYFNSEAGLMLLEESVPKFIAFNDLREERNYPIELSVSISTDEEKLSDAQKERANETINRLSGLNIQTFYDRNGATAGQKFVSAVFPGYYLEPDKILGLACFDQWPLDREEHLEAITELGRKLLRDRKLYACGSRNVPVQLYVNEVPSDMRIIHELVQLLATRTDSFRAQKPEWANPSPHYEHLGELCSGLYLFNPKHHLYETQRKEVLEKRDDVFERPGFAIDYFTAMHAGLNNAVASGYVYAERNPFYAQIDEQTEIEKASKFIKAQTGLVGKTSVRPALETILNDNEELGRLNHFFDSSLVQQTAELMREGLKN